MTDSGELNKATARQRALAEVIDTERLRLTRFVEADADFLVALLNDPAFLANIGDRGVRTPEEAIAYLRRSWLPMYAQHGLGPYRVALPDGTPIGLCGLLVRAGLDRPDLGFAFLPAYRGQRYAAEAARAVLAAAEASLPDASLAAIVKPGNEPSIRLLERLGFRYERTGSLTAGAPAVLIYGRALNRPRSGAAPLPA